MKVKIIFSSLSALAFLLLSSCVDPGYYGAIGTSYSGGSSSYGSNRYSSSYGSSLASLPYGYKTISVGGNPYYYSNSRWYRRSNGRYIGCARPSGYRGSLGGITRLPYGYRTINHGGKIYYYHNNRWYRRSNGRYTSCSRPSGYRGHYGSHHGSSSSYGRSDGRLSAALPKGYKFPSSYTKTKINGKYYHYRGNTWYRRDNKRYYRVAPPVGRPSHYPLYRR